MTIDIATLGIAVDSRGVPKATAELNDLTNAGARAEKSVGALGGVVGTLARAMGALTGVLATVGISRLVSESTALNQRYQEMGIVLGVVSRNAGLLKSDVDAVTKSVKDQGISMIESRSVMTRLIQAQIDLSKATELARLAQDAAVIGQINSSEALDRMIHGITSAQVEVLRGIGINVNFENSYKQLAQQMGVATSSLSEQQKMQARVNIVLAEASKLTGVYEASMDNAGKQMRSTERLVEDLKVKVGGLFDTTANLLVKKYTDTLKNLSDQVDKLAANDGLELWSQRVALGVANVGDTALAATNILKNMFNLSKTGFQQIAMVATGDLKGAMELGTQFFNEVSKDIANTHRLKDEVIALAAERKKLSESAGSTINVRTQEENEALEKQRQLIEEATELAKKYADPLKVLQEQQKKYKEHLDAGRISQDVYNRAMKAANDLYAQPGIKQRKTDLDKLNKAQQEALRIESEYIKLLEIERKQRQDLIAPYKEGAKQAATRLDDMQDEIAALKLVRDRQISMKQAVELTTIARLEEKKAKATDSLVIKEIESEIAARRKVIALIPEYERLQNSSGNAANQVSQQWIQAGRNIQSALSNSIFDFFENGLDGMVRNLKSALLRMLAEAASLRFSESIGSVLLGGSGGTGGVGGTGGQTTGLIASLLGAFGGAGGGIRTGGGVTTGTFSNAGGAGTAYIGGPGTAIGGSGMGVNATRGAGMGSSLMGMAAMAGPYGMIAAATIMAGMELNKKYGDYKVSGFNKFGMNGLNKTDPIAVIANQFGIKGPGEIIGKALFGRGPYKFRQQSIQGDISAGGLDGTITDVYKSKGGLLVKNKHKEFEKDIPSEIVRDIDKNIKSIYKSTGEFADNLGIDARSIDTFTKQIQLKSEKGKALDTEKVKEELDAFNEDMIKSFMPDIDNFKLTGETAGQTFQRLNDELDALKTGVQNLGGSADFAKKLIMDMSIDTRSAIVDMAGGIDKLIEKTQFFSENFLSGTEQIAPTVAMVNEEMTKLGFASVTTKEQFKGLVQSLEISAETRNALLDIAPAFLQILDAAKQIKAEANQNMLSLAQEFAPDLVLGIQRDMANEVLGKFGVTVDTSREKVTSLLTAFVKSGGLFSDMADDVMEAASAWSGFQELIKQTPTAVSAQALPLDKQADNAMAMLLKSIDAERNKLTEKYNAAVKVSNDRITAVTESVNKLKNASDMVKSTVNDIIPMSLEQARSQIANGNADSANLSDALNVLRNQNDTSGFSNVLEFRRSQATNASVLSKFSNSLEGKLTLEERTLAALEASRKTLDDNFKLQNDNLDQLIVDAQAQIEHLKGIFINTVDLNTAIGELNRILLQGGQSAVGGGAVSGGSAGSKPPVSGNLGVSSADIVGYITTHSYMESYKKARELGVTSAQIAATGIFSQQQINDWVKQQGLASFDVGGKVPKTGIAMIHKDEQILTKRESEDMSSQLKKLTTAVEILTVANNKNNRRFQKWDDEGMPPVRESA